MCDTNDSKYQSHAFIMKYSLLFWETYSQDLTENSDYAEYWDQHVEDKLNITSQ
jgi:hypothetical protein